MRQVVVGYYHGHADPPCMVDGIYIGNAAVNGEQYAATLRGQRIDLFHIQPVSFRPPVRNMPESLNAVAFQYVQHQGGSCYSIHIVVAPQASFLPASSSSASNWAASGIWGQRCGGVRLSRRESRKALMACFCEKARLPEHLQ